MDSDSESDGDDKADNSGTETDMSTSQPVTGSIYYTLERPGPQENSVVKEHELITTATEGSMPELAISQTASTCIDTL